MEKVLKDNLTGAGMQRTVEKVFFALIRSEIKGDELCEEIKNLISPEILPALFKLSKRHDLAHLIGDALDKNGLLSDGTEGKKRFLQERNMAVYRYEQIQYEFEQICDVLEKARIPFIPLKGSVIRQYYPEPWMRTSCDIDILVSKDSADTAKVYLVEKLRYTVEGKKSHDISMYAESGVHLELHFDLIEDYIFENTKAVLKDIWEVALKKENCEYHREMSDEVFYFYHIVHMAKHFKGGGCGIRPILDDWILNQKPNNEQARKCLLRKGNLYIFADKIRQVSMCWFSGGSHTPLTLEIEQYILQGGVYGNSENRAAVQQATKGGKVQVIFSRVFLPYYLLKVQYPILEKNKILMPFCQIARWWHLLFGKRTKIAKRELEANMSVAKDKKARIKTLLKDLGI